MEYADVLRFVHWAIQQPEGKGRSFGELIRLGCGRLGKPYPPPHIEEAILRLAYEIASKDIPYSEVLA
jgi:hypothetical protein